MNIGASSSAYGFNPLQQVLGMLHQQPSSSTGQNSPSAPPADAATSSSTALTPASPGRQFAASTLAALLGVQQQSQAQPPSAADIAGKLIGQADSDGDGALSQSEIASALGLGGNSPANSAMQTAVAKLDTDGDGKLSAGELTTAIQQQLSELDGHRHHHGGHKALSSDDLAAKIIGKGDSDGDGALSQAEVTSQLGKAGVSMASSDFAAAFGKLDSNGDGLLSGAELSAAIDALRGQATSPTATATTSGETTAPVTVPTTATA